MYYWRQNPNVYSNFLVQNKPLEWNEHVMFWSKYKNRVDWIINFESRRVGSVYFKILDNNKLDIGIYIADVTLRGRGIGSESIRFAINWAIENKFKSIQAVIKLTNLASKKMFTNLGFVLFKVDSQNYDFEEYILYL